jgi:hypothetical protein
MDWRSVARCLSACLRLFSGSLFLVRCFFNHRFTPIFFVVLRNSPPLFLTSSHPLLHWIFIIVYSIFNIFLFFQLPLFLTPSHPLPFSPSQIQPQRTRGLTQRTQPPPLPHESPAIGASSCPAAAGSGSVGGLTAQRFEPRSVGLGLMGLQTPR